MWFSLVLVICDISWMMKKYFLAQTGVVEVKVNLRSGYGGMAEHLLYGAQIGAPLKEMSGE